MASTTSVLHAARIAFLDNTPTAYILQTTAQTIHTSTDTTINFNFGLNDTWNGWKSGTPTRYTAVIGGLYTMSANVIWNGNATGRRVTYLRVNGAAVPASAGDLASTLSNNIAVTTPVVVRQLNAGDYIEVVANQDTGADLATMTAGQTSSFISSLTVQWLHE